MRSIFLCMFMVLLASTGCETKIKNTYRLSDEQLAQLMLDMHLADVIMPELPANYQDSIRDVMWDRMEGIYNLSEEELKTEIEKLETEPEKLKLIVTRVKELADSIQ